MALLRNVGNTDRAIRSILGLGFVILAIFVASTAMMAWIFYAFAAIMFGTALISFCPIWKLLRVNTYRKQAI